MAMPATLPPPAPDAAPSLADKVRALAERMAKSVGCNVGDVLRRTKSRNWMLGQIRRLTEGHDDDEIREAILGLSKVHRPTPPGEQPVKLTNRQPTSGLEPSEWPIWGGRTELISATLVYPMDMDELLRRSKKALGWARNFTIQSTAAAEDAGELWWDGIYWQRTKERLIVANKNGKIVRVQRRLPVEINDADRQELIRRLNDIEAEKKAATVELDEATKNLKAKLKALDASRERVIDAMRTGRETQSVTCEDRFDYSSGTVTTVRKDTGAVVETREMREDERQTTIPGTAAS
jgi:hypothetical protein